MKQKYGYIISYVTSIADIHGNGGHIMDHYCHCGRLKLKCRKQTILLDFTGFPVLLTNMILNLKR